MDSKPFLTRGQANATYSKLVENARMAGPFSGRVVCVDRGVKFYGGTVGPLTLNGLGGGGGGITSGSTVATFCTDYYVPVTSSSVQLVFGNGGPIAAGGGSYDSANGFAFTIKVGIEAAQPGLSTFTSSQITPITFAGAESYAFPASRMRLIASDPLPVLPSGYYRVRVTVTVSSSTDTIPVSGIRLTNTTLNLRDAVQNGDVAWSGSVTEAAGTYLYGPCAVLGYPLVGQKSSVVIIGDSIADGTGETDIKYAGFIRRGLSGNTNGISTYYNLLQWTRPGAKIQHWVNGLSSSYNWGNIRSTCYSMAEIAIVELGTNELADTAATLQARLTQLYSYLRASGVRRIFQTTLFPKTTSSDSWATLAGQTVTANESDRLTVNTWIRTNCGGLVDGFIDSAALVTQTYSGAEVWSVASGTATTDGTHPNPTYHQIASAAVAAKFPSTGILP
jgi:lysophospholipase L1-like esterase